MFSGTPEVVSPVPPAARRRHSSRWRLPLLFLGLAVLCLLCGAMLHQVMRQRPLDLREMSQSLAREFEQTLQAHDVPGQNISPGEAEFQAFGQGGGWYFHPYQVTVPEQVDLQGLVSLVSRDMSTRGVGVSTTAAPDGRLALSLNLHEAPFVMAVLNQASPERLNLRAGSTRLVNELVALLREAGAETDLTEALQDREDKEALWTFAEFHARFPRMPDLAALQRQVQTLLAGRDASAIVGEGTGGGARLEAMYRGRLIARFHLIAEVPSPEIPPTDATPRQAAEVPETPEAPGPQSTAIQTPPLPPQDELPLDSSMMEKMLLEEEPERLGPLAQAPAIATQGKAKLALIIDDGGYGGGHTDRLLELDPGLTLAILPNTPFAQDIARRAIDKGFEVMLHMPMETFGGAKASFPGEIRTSMAAEEIERLTLDALAQIPGVVGVNNHTGSKYTRDAAKMGEFLRIVQQKQLYFIDSLTITQSAAYDTAKAMNIPSAQRDIFIDNSSAPSEIRKHLKEVISRAKKRGQAIGIGHFRPNTVAVLAEELPRLESYGVELVHASELVR